MMATAPAVNHPANASTSFSFENLLSTDTQNGGSSHSSVNHDSNGASIDSKQALSVEESNSLSAEPSISGGSDSEAVRADGTILKDGGHNRAASTAKKPATFKAVSVNKTFLGSKASGSSPSLKAADRPTTSGTPPAGASLLSVSRPRLIAKTGSGQKDGLSRLSSLNGGKPAAAPGANAVWNKNRPPEPKKLTDEELKKYGIHVASRLNDEDASGQNKWADIDDDDEDWAPDAIQWGDGTKTTLPHLDEAADVANEHVPLPPVIQGPPRSKPTTPAPTLPIVPTVPTVLTAPKAPTATTATTAPTAPPAPRVQPVQKTTTPTPPISKGLILKANHGNPTPDKPTLVTKPPQAQNPAKSPWAILPPVEKVSPVVVAPEPSPGSGTANREFGYPNVSNQAARDGLPDEGNRSSWRDAHQQRELFNHQSGQYEPITDRRGSHSGMRPPAVLQRPRAGDQPAEPSSAFQTTRTSHDPPFGRRRGSSNVSGGSGSFFRKGLDGSGLAPDQPAPRRPSFANYADGPLSPVNATAQPPHQNRPQGQQGWGSRISPNVSNAVPDRAGQPGQPGQPVQPVQAQPTHVEGPQPDEIEYQKKLMRERQELARKRRQEEEAQEQAARQARIQKKLDAMGPPPEKKSDKKQASPQTEPTKPTQIQQRSQSEKKGDTAKPNSQDPNEPTSASSSRSAPKATTPEPQQQALRPPGQTPRRSSHGQGPDGRRPNIWSGPGSQVEQIPPWSAARAQQANHRNVWGSPDADKALGNGTFNPDLGLASGAPGAPAQQPQGPVGPAPIGPPKAARGPPPPPSLQPQPQPKTQAPIGSRQSSRYPISGTDLASQWVSQVAESDRQVAVANIQSRAEREKRLAESGLSLQDAQPVIRDTWRPVQLGSDGSRRTMAPTDAPKPIVNPWRDSRDSRDELGKDSAGDDLAPSTNAGVIGSGSSSLLHSGGQNPTSQSRASRFFPNRENRSDAASTEYGRPGSPSPPPPTMEGHPAYEGDVKKPHVSLPRPHPVVKLPPAMRAGNAPTTTAAITAAAAAAGHETQAPIGWARQQPFKKVIQDQPNSNWQAKIDSLLNSSKSPPKFAGVDPASKSELEMPHLVDSATVSLPSPAFANEVQYNPISKPMAEECFEEQEMGSLPQIKFPHKIPEAAWQPIQLSTKPLPRKLLVEPNLVEPYYFAVEVVGGANSVKILLPGMKEAKNVAAVALFSSARGGRGAHGRGGPRHRGSGRSKRESSDSRTDSAPSSSSAVPSRGGRGAYRGRGSNGKSQSSA